MSHGSRLRFTGHIAGAGTSGGTRLVLGCWTRTPHGPFADVMLQYPDGHRRLLAPDAWVAEFVSATYSFDEITEVPVNVRRTGTANGSRWSVHAGPLDWDFTVGPRAPLGYLLRSVPPPLSTSLTLARLSDRVARRLLPGVRTLGSAGNGRTEWYSARDLHGIAASTVRLGGADLGSLTDMVPPPDFGFGSTPRQPSLTALTTTVRLPGAAERHPR